MADLHVAVLIPGYNLFGQERALLNLSESLRQGGIKVTILLHAEFGKKHLIDNVRERSFAYRLLPMNTIWSPGLFLRNPLELLNNLKKLWDTSRITSRIFAEEKIDVLVTGNWAFAAYVLPALKRSDVAFVYRHGDEPPLSNPLVRRIAKAVFERVDVHVVNCAYLQSRLEAFCKIDTIRMVRNASSAVTHVDVETDRADVARHLVYGGQLSEHKGILVLLDAFDIVAREFTNAKLTLAGAHPGVGAEADMRIMQRLKQSKSCWGDRVNYVGHVDSLSDLFTPETIHVCPSIWDDPSPNVIAEAKACRVPTVAFARGGIPEIVRHGIDGEIVEVETAQALAAALMKLMTSPALFAAQKSAAFDSLNLLPSEDQLVGIWVRAIQDAMAIRAKKTTNGANAH